MPRQQRIPFGDLDSSSTRPTGLNKGQIELWELLHRLSGDRGSWIGPRQTLAAALSCSADTITRRGRGLISAGLLATFPAGRLLEYRLQNAPASLQAGSPVEGPTGLQKRRSAPKNRWWQRPDPNQLSLFDEPATRADVVRRLASTSLQMLSLVVSLVVGPAANRRQTSVIPAAAVSSVVEPAASTSDIDDKTSVITDEPAAKQPETCDEPATKPDTIEPLTHQTITTSSPPPNLESTNFRPIKPMTIGDGASKKFSLWMNAKREDFNDEKKLLEIADRHVKAGLSTPELRQNVIGCVLATIRTAKPTDRLPALITSILRGDPATTKFGPWSARASIDDLDRAKEIIRRVETPAEFLERTSNLGGTLDGDSFQQKRAAAIAIVQKTFRL